MYPWSCPDILSVDTTLGRRLKIKSLFVPWEQYVQHHGNPTSNSTTGHRLCSLRGLHGVIVPTSFSTPAQTMEFEEEVFGHGHYRCARAKICACVDSCRCTASRPCAVPVVLGSASIVVPVSMRSCWCLRLPVWVFFPRWALVVLGSYISIPCVDPFLHFVFLSWLRFWFIVRLWTYMCWRVCVCVSALLSMCACVSASERLCLCMSTFSRFVCS